MADGPDSSAPGPAGPAAGARAAGAVRAPSWRAARWALGRYLAPPSLTGISLLLGVCAAAWLTAGSRAASITGAIALGASAVSARAARRLIARSGSAGHADTGPQAGAARHLQPGQARQAGLAGADALRLAAVCSAAVAGAAVWALAVGGDRAGLTGLWPTAVAAVLLISVRETIQACRGAHGGGGPVARSVGRLLSMPAWGLALLVALAAPAWGARVTLLALLDWSVIALAYAAISPAPGRARRPGAAAGGAGAAARGNADPVDQAAPGDGRRTPAAMPAPAGLALLLARAEVRQPEQSVQAPASPVSGADQYLTRIRQACRDDGWLARWLGRVVRGNLLPLPPTLAGVAGASLLALLGLRGLPGVIVLTPLAVMLLAAPGSSHPHDGRLDWLVPALLQAGQYLYIVTLGRSSGVPWPVIYGLCAVITAWYAWLAAGGARRPAGRVTARSRAGRQMVPAGAGWEERMLTVGLGVIFGIATFAYLALTAYVGTLICWQLASMYRTSGEGGGR